MNDRYLYRAKRTDNGKFVEGFYFCMVHDDGRHIHHFIMPIGTDLSIGTPIENIQVEVDPSTICQCTELKDKNGKLIWENDILVGYLDDMYPENATYAQVIWDKNGFYTKEQDSDNIFLMDEFDEKHFEVCGNIFDNPELLEVGE